MKRLVLIVLLAASFAALAQGRMAPINDPVKVEFKSPAGMTMDRLHDLITVAAASRQWKRVADGDGRMELSFTFNEKHQMRVEVGYDPRGYTVKYLDSVNMAYREQLVDGQPARVIHKRYNQWVRELVMGINAGLGVGAQIVAGP